MFWMVWSKTFYINTPKEEMNLMKKQLDLFKDCGAPCMVFAEVTGSIQNIPNISLSKRPKLNDDDWSKLISRINEISKMMEDEGNALSLSPSHGNSH